MAPQKLEAGGGRAAALRLLRSHGPVGRLEGDETDRFLHSARDQPARTLSLAGPPPLRAAGACAAGASGTAAVMNTIVVIVGIIVLVILAICIGSSLDTEAQRGAAREAARERRERNDELRAIRDERRRLREERLRLAEEQRRRRGDPPADGPLSLR